MKYENIVKGKFISRPNRFIAEVSVDGVNRRAHVKNTGRLKELLVTDTTVYLQDHIGDMGKRKLRYSLIGVEKDGRIVNIDSQVPNKVVHEALLNGRIKLSAMDTLNIIKPEKTHGESRFDFYAEDISGNRAYIEVKGCTLNDSGTGKFPDAPSERAVKHVNELAHLTNEGYYTYIIFVCSMKGIDCFRPNRERHPEFAEALKKAAACGVTVLCYDCIVTGNSIEIDSEILVKF